MRSVRRRGRTRSSNGERAGTSSACGQLTGEVVGVVERVEQIVAVGQDQGRVR